MRKWPVLLLLVLMVLSLLLPGCTQSADQTLLRLYFLDVGQADATLIRSPQGDVLIDAGTEASEALLCERMKQLGVTALSLLVITHTDEDHIGGADGVLEHFAVEQVWLGSGSMENDSAKAMQKAADARAIPCERATTARALMLGELTLTVLAPVALDTTHANEGSLIIKLNYGKVNALFMGDAAAKQERELVARYGADQLAVDLLKVGHHGSNTSTSAVLLEAVRPRYAVISCGKKNDYGFPRGEVLARLGAVEAEILRTDLLGEIVFESNGTQLYPIAENKWKEGT